MRKSNMTIIKRSKVKLFFGIVTINFSLVWFENLGIGFGLIAVPALAGDFRLLLYLSNC